MLIWAAVDLLAGRVVRLRQGDFAQSSDFGPDPVGWARHFAALGADGIHVVDLDGARGGEPGQADTVAAIVAAVAVPVQVAGGLRTAAALACARRSGAARTVLGTGLWERTPDLLAAVAADPQGVAAAWDDDGTGHLRVAGWTRQSPLDRPAARQLLSDLGVSTVVVTDTSRDGTLAGLGAAPPWEWWQRSGFDVVVAGGVATAADVAQLAQAGVAGVVLGRCLYAGTLTLAAARTEAKGC